MPVGARETSSAASSSETLDPSVDARHREESDRRGAENGSDDRSFVTDTQGDPLIHPAIPHVETAPGVGNLTADESTIWTLQHTPYNWQKMIHTNYSIGMERDEEQLKRNNEDHRKWTNPLEIQYAYPGRSVLFGVKG